MQISPISRVRAAIRCVSKRRTFHIAARLACAAAIAVSATSQAADVPPDVVAQLAPSGTLRAAINYGNLTLATKDPATGELHGVSVDLSRELAKRLGVPVKFVEYSAARQVVEGAKAGAWDVGFVGIDPERAKDMLYTAPYVIIEGVYMVRTDSPIKENVDVDQPGVRIAISRGSAYDLFLTRQITKAQLERAPDPAHVTDVMLSQSLEVAAGVKQRLQADAERLGGLRLLPGNFMVIRQAMATLKGRPAGAHYLAGFIEEMKASGFVAESLKRNHVDGASVGPPADAAANAQAPVVAITHLDIVRTNLELAKTLLHDYVETSQQSAGLQKIEVLRQINGENHFTLVEVWANQTAYAAHVSSPAVRTFHGRLDSMLGSPHDEQLYREEDRIEAPQ